MEAQSCICFAALCYILLPSVYEASHAPALLSIYTAIRLWYSRGCRAYKKNLIIFGQTLIDKIAVLSGVAGKLTFTHEGVENIEQLVKMAKAAYFW